MNKLKRCIYEILENGADDWLYLAEIVWRVKCVVGASSDVELRRMSLDLMRDLVQRGLMEIGDVDVSGKKGFTKWDMPIETALERVEREWKALGRDPSMWEICWLSNTDKGNEIGNSLLDLWNAPQDCVEKLLMRGSFYGIVGSSRIAWFAQRIGGAAPGDEVQKWSIELISKVIQEGLMEIGDMNVNAENRVFEKWDLPPYLAVEKADAEWDTPRGCAAISNAFWLRNTSKGEQIGQRLLHEWPGFHRLKIDE
jgi:hypothetical protein